MSDCADTVELRSLVDQYALALDSRDVAAFLDLWIDGGVLLVHEEGPRTEAVRLRLPRAAKPIMGRLDDYVQTLHQVTTHHANVVGESASGITYCRADHVLRRSEHQVQSKVLSIRYDDEFERVRGAWKFVQRRINVLLREHRSVVSLS